MIVLIEVAQNGMEDVQVPAQNVCAYHQHLLAQIVKV